MSSRDRPSSPMAPASRRRRRDSPTPPPRDRDRPISPPLSHAELRPSQGPPPHLAPPISGQNLPGPSYARGGQPHLVPNGAFMYNISNGTASPAGFIPSVGIRPLHTTFHGPIQQIIGQTTEEPITMRPREVGSNNRIRPAESRPRPLRRVSHVPLRPVDPSATPSPLPRLRPPNPNTRNPYPFGVYPIPPRNIPPQPLAAPFGDLAPSAPRRTRPSASRIDDNLLGPPAPGPRMPWPQPPPWSYYVNQDGQLIPDFAPPHNGPGPLNPNDRPARPRIDFFFPFGIMPQEVRPSPEKAKELLRAMKTVGWGMMRRVDRITIAEDGEGGEDEKGWKCGICLEGAEYGLEEVQVEGGGPGVKALSCNHLFHEECLQPWFETNHTW
jgi:hypothetical protein